MYKVKNASLLANVTVRKLFARKLLFLTATPTLNRLFNLKGTLTLFYECLRRNLGPPKQLSANNDLDEDDAALTADESDNNGFKEALT